MSVTAVSNGPQEGLRIAVSLASLVPDFLPDMSDLPDFGAQAEAWGTDTLAIGEHVAWFERMRHHSGELLEPGLMASLPDALAVCSALAGCTSTIRFMPTLVGGLRHPLALARAAASVERISRGRFDFGLAPGWSRDEYRALGVPFEERHARLKESLAVYETLWQHDGPSSFSGQHYSFDDVLPRPFPGAPIPIWLGGPPKSTTARNVARYAAGWISRLGAPPAEIEQGVKAIADACNDLGRDPRTVRVTAQLGAGRRGFSDQAGVLKSVVHQVEALADAGATQVVLPVADLAGDVAGIGDLVTGVVAALRGR